MHCFLFKNLFCKNVRMKKYPKFKNTDMSRTYTRFQLEKTKNLYFGNYTISWKNLFLGWCSTVPKYFYFFKNIIAFLPARVAANLIERFYASGWFVRLENNKCTLNTNKTIWGEILKTFKNIQSQPKKKTDVFFKKKNECTTIAIDLSIAFILMLTLLNSSPPVPENKL